jgi:UDPglucose--hexose-1-phosphate uridylyltransferase
MPELRRHYFLDEYCIIAAERKKKPSDFNRERSRAADEKRCPFCPGNEEITPPGVAVYTEHGVLADGPERIRNWQMRVFPNLFAAVVPSPVPPTAEWIALSGRGCHEVIVDSPQHDENPADFSQDHMERLCQVYQDRYVHYQSRGQYVSIFKNWGNEAGASLSHSHSQVIVIPVIPPLIVREVEAISKASFCLFCNVIDRERASSRLIAENDNWILISPFYSIAPYEIWILPKRHFGNLAEMVDEELKSLASILKRALVSINLLLNNPPYNCMIHQLSSGYHLSIRIQPAISKIAGFERNTGIYINSIPPEKAASELRLVLGAPKG